MKRVLCFGDSNTFGYQPVDGSRYQKNHRYTGVIQRLLFDKVEVIEEGCCGRTTVFKDDFDPYICGKEHLLVSLRSHQPLDLIILFLGTNDLKYTDALGSGEGVGELLYLIENYCFSKDCPTPQVLLLSPMRINDGILQNPGFGFDERCIKESEKFPMVFQRIAAQYHCEWMDLNTIVSASQIDGIHLLAHEHEKLGKALSLKICEMLGL